MRVIIDSDLAALYGVRTKVLLQAVRRHIDRFPSDFLITLKKHEVANLRSQLVTSSGGWGGRRHSLKAFTEHGAVMAATVLNSPRAIAMSILVVRTFVEMRASIVLHAGLAKRLDDLEKRLERRLGGHDEAIADILEAIRTLMTPPNSPRRGIGFVR
jgi:ATP-dependent Clp protease ATP-binding subunit ClpA